MLYYNNLIVSNKVVSNLFNFSFFIYYTIYYLLFIHIYLLLTTYYTILLCFNDLAVGSNMIF